MAMRVAGEENSKGSKGMVLVTRVAGKRTGTATNRAMAKKTREAGEEEGNGKGGKSNCNGKEDGNGK
jgi:hypothetical protein